MITTVQFSKNDIQKIHEKGQSPGKIRSHLKLFEKEYSFTKIQAPCFIGKGIKKVRKSEFNRLAHLHSHAASTGRITNFVPATETGGGMFKFLHPVYNQLKIGGKNTLVDSSRNHSVETGWFYRFVKEIRRFPFFKDLEDAMAKHGLNIDSVVTQKQYALLIEYINTHAPIFF